MSEPTDQDVAAKSCLDATTALTEQLAAAWRQAANDYAGDDMECMDALCAQAAIETVVSARLVDDCPTCHGSGRVGRRIDPIGSVQLNPCEPCEGSGKRYGPLLVAMATMGDYEVLVPGRWVDEVVLALKAATTIGIRERAHINYGNHARLVNEAAAWPVCVESSSLPTRLEAVSSPVKEDGTTTSDAVAKSRLARRPGETQ